MVKQSKIHSSFVLLLIVFQSLVQPVQGQTSASHNEKPLSLEICFARTNMLGSVFPGMSGHYLVFLTERFGTGLSLFSVQNQVDQNFGYSIINPQLLLSQYGWINQFILINNKYVKFKLNFTNGLIQIRLLEDSQRYNSGQYVFPPNLERNFYYFLQPGTDLSLRLFGPLYVTAGINYRFLIGRSHFSDRKEFQSTGFSLGLTMSNNKQ